MSKPYIHAQSSAKQFGGTPEDYIDIHNWFDETKAIIADQRHRALRHHSEGILLCERIFGVTRTNSDGHIYSVRDIGEQHVLEDFGNRFIPSAQDYLSQIEFQDWMQNGRGVPPSFAKVNEHRKRKTKAKTEPAVEVTPSPGDMVFDGSRGKSPTALSPSSMIVDGSSLAPGFREAMEAMRVKNPSPTTSRHLPSELKD